MTLTKQAQLVAARCSNAYSVRRYRSWASVARALLQRGYNEQEAEGIMRSKYTRWAADSHGGKYGTVPGKAILDYIDGVSDEMLKADVADFVRELPQNQIHES